MLDPNAPSFFPTYQRIDFWYLDLMDEFAMLSQTGAICL